MNGVHVGFPDRERIGVAGQIFDFPGQVAAYPDPGGVVSGEAHKPAVFTVVGSAGFSGGNGVF